MLSGKFQKIKLIIRGWKIGRDKLGVKGGR